MLQEMIKKVPDGVGCVMRNARYNAHKNYKTIRSADSRSVICTRKNHMVNGFDLRAVMFRWQKRNPEEFEKLSEVFLAT